jgi:D-sedoheptulose 7-phosphate isomerase
VLQKKTDLSLAARLAQFGAIVGACAIGDRQGRDLGIEGGVTAVAEILARVRSDNGAVYVIGNGGSAGIASHVITDFVNVAKLRAYTLHDSSLLTCMANDYGYENAFARLLKQMAKPGDALVAISSSGRSANIRNAAAQITESGGKVITLSGFACDNPLRALGDINIWLDSMDYGFVEIGHQFVLHNVADRFGAGTFG